MLKVLEVSSDSNIGGAGKCILTFLKTFDRSRFSVGAVLPKDSLLKPEIAALDIPVYEMENLAEKSLDFRAVRALRRLFQKLKPDVVHTHASMSARFAAFSLGIPVVYTRHSVFPPPAALTRIKFCNAAVFRIVTAVEHEIAVGKYLFGTGAEPEVYQIKVVCCLMYQKTAAVALITVPSSEIIRPV